MCGISGVYHYRAERRVSEGEIIRMRETLLHRGPDDGGLYINKDQRVGFGFRRLAIIDLSEKGHQPMLTPDGKLCTMLNGEIYNFQKIRENLQSKGYEFQSKSDTEVILHSYREFGISAVERWNGMFAVALWDEKKLFLIRDRLGIKPIYYADCAGTILFASEIKAILAHPLVHKKLNREALFHYLTFACCPAPLTLFEGIKKIAPGTYLEIDERGVREHRYFDPLPQKSSLHEEDFVREVRRLLTDSVQEQMVSDVPFGVFLSGGIDSSTNTALMTHARGKPVDSFSVNIDQLPRYDEFSWARKVSKIFDSRHHEITVGPRELLEFLPTLAHHADDPNGDPVCFPLYFVSKLIRDSGVIVAQVGEGSDELFAGYQHYLLVVDFWKKWWRLLERFPRPLKKLAFELSKIAGHPGHDLHRDQLRKLAAAEEFFWGGAIAFHEFSKWKILSREFSREMEGRSSYAFVSSYYTHVDQRAPDADFLTRMIYLELSIRLPELLLMRVDKMTMANSIEARVPFLDHRLVELAMSIPMDQKIKNGNPKHILKEAVRGIIPNEIIDRKKQGFGAPIQEWLNGALREELPAMLWRSKIWEANLFDRASVAQLLEDHQSGRSEASFKIWNLITLGLWFDRWMA